MSSFGVECRVDRTPASASRGTDRRRRHHRSIVTNKPSTSAAMRRAARCPQSAAQAADAGRAACRSISDAHRCPRAPLGQSERDHRRSPQRSCLNRLPSRATPYLAPAAGATISATTLARASRQRERLTLPISADRSVSQVPTPIQGTKTQGIVRKPSSADDIDVVVWRRVSC